MSFQNIVRHPLSASLVRIRSNHGRVVGTGFLIDTATVCTCAHVVAEALDLKPIPVAQPNDMLFVDFPFIDQHMRSAHVSDWHPPRAGGGDVALLHVSEVPPLGLPAPLLLPQSYLDRRVIVCGFPSDVARGVWADSVLRYPVVNGRVQMNGLRPLAPFIQPGFSGAPVWDISGAGVAGMVVETVNDTANGRFASMISTATLLEHFPQMRRYARPPRDAITTATLAAELTYQGSFTPAGELNLAPPAMQLTKAFDFYGIKWSSLFAFTVALVTADGRSNEELDAIRQQFVALNNTIYRQPKGLDIPGIIWLVGFTLSGVLCFVYEQGADTAAYEYIARSQHGAPAYAQGLAKFLWVQTSATSLFWTIDVPARTFITHRGKQPDGSNYHARKTVTESSNLERILEKRLADGRAHFDSEAV